MPDDPEEADEPSGDAEGPGLYPKMIQAARTISDPDVSEEVQLVAELYKKALEMNGGYTYIGRALSNVIDVLDEDDESEQEAVEDLLNEVSRDVRARAKTAGTMGKPDDDKVLRALREVKNQFEQRMVQEHVDEGPSAFEAGLTGYQENEEGEVRPGLQQYEESAGGTFDPTGGVRGEPGVANRGYYVSGRSYTDWLQRYNNELERFKQDANDPELTVIKGVGEEGGKEAKRKASIRRNLTYLIQILEQVVRLTAQVTQLENQVQVAPDDAEAKTQLADATKKLSELQTERRKLKKNLGKLMQTNKMNELQSQLGQAKTPEEQNYYQQQIALQQLRLSDDSKKAQEIKWRKTLIKALATRDPSGNLIFQKISPDTLKKIQEGIDAGEALKRKTSEKDKATAERIKALKGLKGPSVSKEERQLGKGQSAKRNEYVEANLSLEGFIRHITESIASKRKTIKDRVLRKLKDAGHDPGLLKPFLDDVATAANDRRNIGPAAKALRLKMSEFAKAQPEVVQYLIGARIAKLFLGYRNQLQVINNWIKTQDTPMPVEQIQAAIEYGNALIPRVEALKVKPLDPSKAPYEVAWGPAWKAQAKGTTPTEWIAKINSYLADLAKGVEG